MFVFVFANVSYVVFVFSKLTDDRRQLVTVYSLQRSEADSAKGYVFVQL